MGTISNWMKKLGGYEVVDEKARGRLDKYDTDLPVQFKGVDDKIDEVTNNLTEHINTADKKMNQMNTDLTDKIDDVNSTLNKKIDSTKSELGNNIETLNNKVNQVNANLANSISANSIADRKYTDTEVKEEADSRSAADNVLQENIDAEVTAREDADNVLDKKIQTETSARQSANQLLEQLIANEKKTREEALAATNTLIEGVQGDLTGYYLKEETYSRDEVQSLISAIPKFAIEVVSALPTENIGGTTVYLLKTGDESSNIYTEYIYSNGKWESLGTQSVDLSGYALKSDLTGYLPLSGGTITDGHLLINRTTNNESVLQISNTLRSVQTIIGTAGLFGFYDVTRDEWVLCSRTDGSVEIPHPTTINGFKVLTAADVTIENGVTVINLQ